jgi:hypothetical protein
VRAWKVSSGERCRDGIALKADGGEPKSGALQEVAAEAAGEIDDRTPEGGEAAGTPPGDGGVGHHFEAVGGEEEAEIFPEALASLRGEGYLLRKGSGFKRREGASEASGKLHRSE